MTATVSRPVRTSRAVLVAAWAFPVLIFGQFALLAGIPVAVVLAGTLRDRRLHPARWWTGLLTAAYVVPLVAWLLGPGTAPSLSKSMSPLVTVLVGVAGVAAAVGHHVLRRRSA
ncbi:hypothetical protein M8542_32400 [Amycolatopsis sp. OK19-0408]|uniref:Uncharacterized protein n=1 Tax=Amycolatopsis iheyensis TaxID=2945988 RepID=A0A9X2SME5_9PSEU|nr:hypothetical protein [Amycolatopsis iheyensis]MCR6487539.1 hypothetical protein [Amycolatopsis iheyensis]